MSTAWSSFRSAMRRFQHAREGNIAITFAIAVIPLLGFVDAAIDYSRANAVRVRLQSALDSTALMMARDAPNLSDVSNGCDQNSQNCQPSDLDCKAQAIFTSLFNPSDASNININATYSTTRGSSVKIDASADVPTTFLAIVGYNTIAVGSSTTSKWGSSRLRVALVLDNTGSMAQSGKMTALKTATTNLLAQLQRAASTDDDVYVSIIPFTKDVNVGSGFYSADWIDWIDWIDWEDNNGTCAKSSNGKNFNASSCGSKHWTPANHITWNGCITDRDKDYDQNVTAPNPADATLPVGQASTLFPAEQYGNCPVVMMGLNFNWSTMNSLVNSMTPNGNTNQPIGLVWGWKSLVGGGPFATVPAMDTNYKYNQIIILLTDGLNTEDRWYKRQTPIDNRMYQTGNGSGTCANIKAAGLMIYTIQVNTGGDPTSALLQNCASPVDTDPKGPKFFLLTSADQILTTFQSIGTSLTKLRVAK